MNQMMRRSAVVLGLTSVLFLSACGDDDPDPVVTPTVTATATATATETATATPSPTGEAAATTPVHLVCPAPVGEVNALTDADDEWGPAYVVGSDTVLEPVAFGKVTGTSSDGGTFSEAPKNKPGTGKSDAIKCAFTMQLVTEGPSGADVIVNLKGTVWVLVK